MKNTHYFRLDFICQPGGSRKTEYYVLGTLEEAVEVLRQDLGSGQGAYHALFYGEDILLECWQDGRKIAEIDLHPFITYSIEGIDRPLTFPGTGNKPLLDIYDPAMAAFIDKILEEEIAISVSIAETEIRLPELSGSPLATGSSAPFENGLNWNYGPHREWDHYLNILHESLVIYRPSDLPLLNLIAEHFGVSKSVRQSYFYFYRKGQSLNWPPESELSDRELEAGFDFIQYLADHILFFASPFRDFFINTFQINNTVGLTHGWHPDASLEQISDIAISSGLDLHNMAELFEKSDDINIEKRLQNFPEELEFKGGPAFTSLLHYLETGEELPTKSDPELIELLIEGLEGFHLTEEIEQRLREVFKILIVY